MCEGDVFCERPKQKQKMKPGHKKVMYNCLINISATCIYNLDDFYSRVSILINTNGMLVTVVKEQNVNK